MFNFLLEETPVNSENSWVMYVVLIGLMILMLVVPTVTNKKRAKEYNTMIDNLCVGDTVRTVGGIIGRITKINNNEDGKTFILETGAKNSKTTMEFDVASIYVVLNSKKQQEQPVKAEEVSVANEQVAQVEETPKESNVAEDVVFAKPKKKSSKNK